MFEYNPYYIFIVILHLFIYNYFFTHHNNIKYSYLWQIICTQLYDSNFNSNNAQIKKPHLKKRIPNKDNYKFGTDTTMEDQIRRTNNWIYETKKSNLDHPSGPVAQQIEVLSRYSSRRALSEDSCFNSYPSRPESYSVKTWCDRQQLWKAVITGDMVTRPSIPIWGHS